MLTIAEPESVLDLPDHRIQTLDEIDALRGKTIYCVRNYSERAVSDIVPIEVGPIIYEVNKWTSPGQRMRQWCPGEEPPERPFVLDINSISGEIIRGARMDLFGLNNDRQHQCGYSAIFEDEADATSWATMVKLAVTDDIVPTYWKAGWNMTFNLSVCRELFIF